MRALLVAALAAALAVPAVAIADRGPSDNSARAALDVAKKQKRAKAKPRNARRTTPRLVRSTFDDEREVRGRIVSLAPLRVGSLTCMVHAGLSLAGFRVGDFVEATCHLVRGQWILRRLKHEDDDERGVDDDERELKGRIASLAPLTVGSLTCVVPAGVSLARFRVGDFVEITCDRIRGQWVLRKLEHEDRNDDDNDNSGPGSSRDHDDDGDHSGPGGGDDDDDNSGRGGSGDDDDDNSGSGSSSDSDG